MIVVVAGVDDPVVESTAVVVSNLVVGSVVVFVAVVVLVNAVLDVLTVLTEVVTEIKDLNLFSKRNCFETEQLKLLDFELLQFI